MILAANTDSTSLYPFTSFLNSFHTTRHGYSSPSEPQPFSWSCWRQVSQLPRLDGPICPSVGEFAESVSIPSPWRDYGC